ncbi:hypothetical protein BH11BAC3_BH11BAC3_09260 [soil metagenome]
MRKKLITSVSLLVLLVQLGISQSLRQPISAVYLGLGSYSTQHTDVFSFLNNQAALAQVKDVAVGVYGEKRFLLNATSMYAAALAIPSKMGNFGVSMKYAGYKNFNENQIGLAYGRSLGSKVDLGIQFNYYGYKVPSYTSANAVDFEIGAIVHLTDQLNAGIHVYNPVGGNFSKTDEKLTSAYKIGLGYDVSEQFFISAEVVKEEDYPINLNAGIQYQFVKQFFVRAGVSSATSTGYAGVGLSWNNLRLDISGSYHPQLGLSPGLLLIMNFADKKK